MTTEAKREAVLSLTFANTPPIDWSDFEWAQFNDAIMALAEPQVSDDTVRVPNIMLPPGTADGEYLDGWIEGQQYLIHNMAAAPASEPQALSEERAREVLRSHGISATSTRDEIVRAMIRFATETQKGSGE